MSTRENWVRRTLGRLGIASMGALDDRGPSGDAGAQSNDATGRQSRAGSRRTGQREQPADGESDVSEIAELSAAAERIKYSGEFRPADVSLVEAGLERRDRDVRKLATETVASVDPDRLSDPSAAVAALVETLAAGDLVLRITASRSLVRLAPSIPADIAAVAPQLAPYVDDFNVWVSDNVAAALRAAARSAPDSVAPHVFGSVGIDRWNTDRNTLRNALSVVRAAGETSPESVEPVVPALLDLLETSRRPPVAALETLAAVAPTAPSRVAPGIPSLEDCVTERTGEPAHAAAETLAAIARADPALAHSTVPTLVAYLTRRDRRSPDAVATALVAIVDARLDERATVLFELSTSDGFGRLRAARALSGTNTDTGRSIAEAALEGTSLQCFLPRSTEQSQS